MLLPQSSAFAALKNRLNSVSNIGLLHTPRPYVLPSETAIFPLYPYARFFHKFLILDPFLFCTMSQIRLIYQCLSYSSSPLNSASSTSSIPYERSGGRLKSRDETGIRWVELLDKFKSVQERSRRSRRSSSQQRDFDLDRHDVPYAGTGLVPSGMGLGGGKDKNPPGVPGANNGGGAGSGRPGTDTPGGTTQKTPLQKTKSSLGSFGRLGNLGQRRLRR